MPNLFKKLEDQNLGAMVKTPISHQEVVRTSISFVDDTCFHTNGSNFIEKMQEVMNLCTGSHEVTGEKTQRTKLIFYCWRWVGKSGDKEIDEFSANLVVHGE